MKREAQIQRYGTPTANILVDTNHRSWWNSLSDGQRRFVASLSIVLGVSVIALVAFYFARRSVQNARAAKQQNQSFGVNKHATWAKQFKQAFDNDGWWGTDVPLVRQTMRAIPSKDDFAKVQESYRLMYKGANLIEDMSDELTKLEYEEMLAIRNSKPQAAKEGTVVKVYDPEGWARRIHAAVNYSWIGFLPGTDEDAIKAVFNEIPTQTAFWQTHAAYKRIYALNLVNELDGDLDWSMDWRALLHKKPKK